MKHFLLVAFLAASVCALIAKPVESNIATLLKAQAEAWDKAIVAKNLNGISENIGSDFRQIDGDGTVCTREAFIADLMSSDLRIDPYTVEDFDVRVYGEVALLCGRTRMTGTYKNKAFKSHYRYVDTYHLENGKWRVVNIQITKIVE